MQAQIHRVLNPHPRRKGQTMIPEPPARKPCVRPARPAKAQIASVSTWFARIVIED
jgi:hypothetical protein